MTTAYHAADHMTAAEILRFAHCTMLGATIALLHETQLDAAAATDVIQIAMGVDPRVGTVLIDGYLTGAFA